MKQTYFPEEDITNKTINDPKMIQLVYDFETHHFYEVWGSCRTFSR